MGDTDKKLPFDQIAGFQITSIIENGDYTWTCRGFEADLERHVFIKILKPDVPEHVLWQHRFQNEAKLCARLKHPNIVEIYSIGRTGKYHYIVMEFVNGLSLKDFLSGWKEPPLEFSIAISQQILKTLVYIHQHDVVHRDIKPGNILIDKFGTVKLSDFGFAISKDLPDPFPPDSLIGTPAYMAPEQITRDEITERSDLFAFGAVLFELITGHKAFGGENYNICFNRILNDPLPEISQFRADIHTTIAEFSRRFLEKTPENRWDSAKSALAKLEQINENLKINATQFAVQTCIEKVMNPSAVLDASKIPETEKKVGFFPYPYAFRLIRFIVPVLIIFILGFFFYQYRQDLSRDNSGTENHAGNSRETTESGSPAGNSLKTFKEVESETVMADKSDLAKKTTNVYNVPDQFHRQRTSYMEKNSEQAGEKYDTTNSFLSILVNPWARLYINDQLIDSQLTRHNAEVHPGSYSLTFIHPAFSPHQETIRVAAGEKKEIIWSFLDQTGYLWIDVLPWGKIYIDGKLSDTTPLNAPLPLARGKHLVELRHPNYLTYRKTIEILPGDTVRMQVKLPDR